MEMPCKEETLAPTLPMLMLASPAGSTMLIP